MKRVKKRKSLLFIGVLTTIGFPLNLKEKLENEFGEIEEITPSFSFSIFTTYYEKEMGKNIERFFICFSQLQKEESLKTIKLKTIEIEKEYSENGNRRINLDPGLINEGSLILPTTKPSAHRINIGNNLYAELTLFYRGKKWETFFWTYPDFRSDYVQEIMTNFRKKYLEKRNINKKLDKRKTLNDIDMW